MEKKDFSNQSQNFVRSFLIVVCMREQVCPLFHAHWLFVIVIHITKTVLSRTTVCSSS